MLRGFNQDGERERFLMAGIALQTAKQVGRLSMLTLGAELYYDRSLEQKMEREEIDASPLKAGLMVGHEFLLGQFQFSQRLGVYIFDKTPYYDRLFHRWGIKYRISRYFTAGFNLLAHRQVAEYVDFRLGYTLQKRVSIE